MGTGRKAAIALIVVALGAAALISWPHVRSPANARDDAAPGAAEAPSETSGTSDRRHRRSDHAPSSSDRSPTEPGVAGEPIQVAVTGLVHRAETREPVPSVDVIFSSGRSEWTATSDGSGRYSVALPPGTYRVRAVGDLVIGVGLPALEIGSTAASYDVAVVQRAVVRGRARYRDGSPASGATVVGYSNAKSVAALAARGELGTADVQPDGTFELVTAPVKLVVHASDGHASAKAYAGNLEPGQHVDGIKLVLVPNGYVAGVVVDPTGAPVAKANVLVSVEVPGTGEYDRVPQVTDDRGRFRWDLPRPGAIIVEASARGFAQSAPIAFVLEPGENRTGLELALREASYTLAGRVVDEQGDPVALVEVAQGVEGSKARYKKTFTGVDGGFEIDDLGRGPHRLRARKSGYRLTRVRHLIAPKRNIEIVMPRETPSTR